MADRDKHIGIEKLREELKSCEAVIAGAGAGLSASAGFSYTGERFHRYFHDFAGRYGFTDMYYGGFYPYGTLEEHWAYWSRYIYINRYMPAPKPVYRDLRKLLQGKDYFVLTTNVDHQFQNAGFDKHRLFYTQGDYGLFQCSGPCHKETYDNKETICEMVKAQGYRIREDGSLYMPENAAAKMSVPAELVPCCPKCGRPMSMNLRSDDTFVEDGGWHMAAQRYNTFLQEHKSKRLLLLELGCGMNTPGIIKYSFWRMASQHAKTEYICINKGEAYAPKEIAGKSVCIDSDIGEILSVAAGSTDSMF